MRAVRAIARRMARNPCQILAVVSSSSPLWLLLLLAATGGNCAKNDGLVLISPPRELQEEDGAFRISAKYGILPGNSL